MINDPEKFDITIVGGGFFGATLAVYMRQRYSRVLLLEKEDILLTRASLWNQARVHGGYHYPRSITTGLRSSGNYRIFVDMYRDCVVDSFTKYYAIAKKFSKVSAAQFKLFCQRIEAPLELAPDGVMKDFNKDLIEAVFVVQECAFDAVKLRNRLLSELAEAGVTVRTSSPATLIRRNSDDSIAVSIDERGKNYLVQSGQVFLCTYSQMNTLLHDSSLPLIPIRNEFTEMGLVEVPERFKKAGITLMCGPFFSVMPFPSKGLHSFSHVRYTPHFTWSEDDAHPPGQLFRPYQDHPPSKFTFMQHDAARYMPLLNECVLKESVWEVKTLLPRNEHDDARPILLKRNHGFPNVTCIIGGKIDNVFDVFQELEMGH